MIKKIICTIVLIVSVNLLNANAPSISDNKEVHAGLTGTIAEKKVDPLRAEADSVLHEARISMSDATSARQRIAGLEKVLDKVPDYPYRADLFYYVGLNAHLLGDEKKAVKAFENALQTEPAIANETPIMAYLEKAKSHTFTRTVNLFLITVLVITLLSALWLLTRVNTIKLPWGRLFTLYAGFVIVWVILVFTLPLLFGPTQTGLQDFPKPTLSNFHLGQIGDLPLRALLWYGVAAILATLPVVTASSQLKPFSARTLATIAGSFLVVGSLMGLYWVRHLYINAKLHQSNARLVFFVKSIDTMKDVPDAMLPLYDKKFTKRILKSRKKAAE